MEKNIKIKLSKRFSLYGKFSGDFNQPLFIVVHGLPGNMDEEFYYSATQWFSKHGFATFRFNLYGYQKDARQLMNCTLYIHASDFDTIIRYFRKKGVKKIFVAGHSFGGLTILSSVEQDFNGAVLWDPSYKISFIKKKHGFPSGKYIKEINGYLMKWGVNIIIAGKGALKGAKNYLKGVKAEKNFIIIKEATHYFNDKKGMQEKVFKTSAEWFKKFMKIK